MRETSCRNEATWSWHERSRRLHASLREREGLFLARVVHHVLDYIGRDSLPKGWPWFDTHPLDANSDNSHLAWINADVRRGGLDGVLPRVIKETSVTQRVCSVAFVPGDIVWNCKTCQKDDTCVLCQECFSNSNHEGHEVFFYQVQTNCGGCCDCGDPDAWDPKGFCSRHGAHDVDPVHSLPLNLRRRSKRLFEAIAKFLVYSTSILDVSKSALVFAVPESIREEGVTL